MKKITILITENHILVRNSLTMMLDHDDRFQVIGQCDSGEEAVVMAMKLKPDIILMDINLKGISGLAATALIVKQLPQAKVIGLSMLAHTKASRKMLEAGAKGYMTKNSSREELLKGISEVYKNGWYVCDEIKQKLADDLLINDIETSRMNLLSPSEINILGYVKQGLSSREIATVINRCQKTVEVHRHNILKKLQLRNVAALVNYVNESTFLLL